MDNPALGPAVCIHKYVSISPSGSELPVPSKITSALSFTVLSGPALATGGWFTTGNGEIVIMTVSVSVRPSLSVTVNVNVRISPSASTSGAANDGAAVLASISSTDVPLICVQE